MHIKSCWVNEWPARIVKYSMYSSTFSSLPPLPLGYSQCPVIINDMCHFWSEKIKNGVGSPLSISPIGRAGGKEFWEGRVVDARILDPCRTTVGKLSRRAHDPYPNSHGWEINFVDSVHWFSTGSNFISLGTFFGHVWRHFCLSWLGRSVGI